MKKMHLKILSMILVGGLVLSGCNKQVQPIQDSTTTTEITETVETTDGKEVNSQEPLELVSTQQLASSLKEKYSSSEKVIYISPEYDLQRDHVFHMEIAFHPLEKGYENFSELVGFYADANFTQEVRAAYEAEDLGEDNFKIICKPGRTPAGAISTQFRENGKEKRLGEGYYLHAKDEYSDWGNLSQYYMVQWVDLITGDKLEKPIVKVFTIKTELDTPEAEFFINEDGSPGFKWQEVEGAETYYILEMTTFNGAFNIATVMDMTTETSWTYDNEDAYPMNRKFHKYTSSAKDESEEKDETFFAVIAAGEIGTSSVNKLFTAKEITYRLPYSLDIDQLNADNTNSSFADSIGLMPAQIPIVMCDDSTVLKTINYEIEDAKIKTETWATQDSEGGYTPYKATFVEVPYTIEGTTFRKTLKIENFNESTYEEELKAIQKRQNDLRGKGGSEQSGKQNLNGEEPEDNIQVEDQVADYGDKIFATSALSEYLASNMMAGNRFVSLSDFPESSDRELLIDSWQEAVYQNPLILGVQGIKMSPDNNTLIVVYDDEQEVMATKQEEIRQEVKKVVGEIITDSMTDLEKEIAINNYLCDSAEYDHEALENAEENNFESVDEKYNDSFTAYGILVNKVGVCASYSACFKLLADEAGLESIVVTGYLEGTLPHAWNRVKISDEWITVDSTNNDNPLLFNAILNLPDDAAAALLVEDAIYMKDDFIDEYKATKGDNEYYRVIDQYYTEEKITEQLVNDLKENKGIVTLRTEYNLDDETFQKIAQGVMDELGVDSLYGFHWMGVITMALDADSLVVNE